MPMLTDSSKTIHMPKAIWDKWEAALLDPESKQGVGALCDGKGYCCLGLLQMAVDGKVETLSEAAVKDLETEYAPGTGPKVGDSALTPTLEWLARNGINFRSKFTETARVPEVYDRGTFEMVSELNDGGRSFADILELMRPHVHTY